MDITLRNCRAVTPGGLVYGDISIKDGLIDSVGQGDPADFEYDCKGRLVMPGAVDIHVHLREPGWPQKEDIASGSAAALLGGITTVFDMPNNLPPTTTIDALKDKMDRAQGRTYTDIGFYMGMTPDNIQALQKAQNEGLLMGIKAFLGASTASMLVRPQQVFDTMQKIDSLYLFHGELQEILNRGKPAGRIEDYPLNRPERAALKGLEAVIRLARETARKCHYLHISTKSETELLEQGKPDNLTVGVTPNHLAFSSLDYERLGRVLKVNPPIRGEGHGQALMTALKAGLIDNIETDHAPHLLKEKMLAFQQAPAGIPGLDSMVSYALTMAKQQEIDFVQLSRLISHNPASIVGLNDRGELRPGLRADLMVVDPDASTAFSQAGVASRAGWSPFSGMNLVPKPDLVILNGRLTVFNGAIAEGPLGMVLNRRHNYQ